MISGNSDVKNKNMKEVTLTRLLEFSKVFELHLGVDDEAMPGIWQANTNWRLKLPPELQTISRGDFRLLRSTGRHQELTRMFCKLLVIQKITQCLVIEGYYSKTSKSNKKFITSFAIGSYYKEYSDSSSILEFRCWNTSISSVNRH